MNIAEGYAAINCSDSFVTKWVGVIAGNIWCEKHRKTPDMRIPNFNNYKQNLIYNPFNIKEKYYE
jgi:hypothetical protein